MVKILYDYDARTFLKGEYYSVNTRRKELIDLSFIDELLMKGHHIYNFHYIGGGSDCVTIVNDKSNSFYLIEPINGLVFAYQMTIALNNYERQPVHKSDFDCSILMDETIFRHHRNDDEYLLLGKVVNENDNIKLQFKYPNCRLQFDCDYVLFVKELVSFTDKMLELHISILPNFKKYPWYEVFVKTFETNNILREKYINLYTQNDGNTFLDNLKLTHPA
jgi:hypothetical protein